MMDEYRFAKASGGPRILRFIGATLLGVVAVLGVTLVGAPGVVPVTYPILGIAAAVGLGLLLVGKVLPSDEFLLTREGLRDGRAGTIVPWGEIASGRLSARNGWLELFAGDGREVASIPTHLPGIDHLAILLVDALPARNASSDVFVRGTPSPWRMLLLYGGALALAVKAYGDGISRSSARSWVGFGILAMLILFQVYAAWRRAGAINLSIDAQGVHASDRFGAFSVRWGEIDEMTIVLTSFRHEESPVFTLHPSGQRPRRLSLAGLDLVQVLTALRTHAPVHWARFVAIARQGALPPAGPRPPRLQEASR